MSRFRSCTICALNGDSRRAEHVATGADGMQWFECADHQAHDHPAGFLRQRIEPLLEFLRRAQMPAQPTCGRCVHFADDPGISAICVEHGHHVKKDDVPRAPEHDGQGYTGGHVACDAFRLLVVALVLLVLAGCGHVSESPTECGGNVVCADISQPGDLGGSAGAPPADEGGRMNLAGSPLTGGAAGSLGLETGGSSLGGSEPRSGAPGIAGSSASTGGSPGSEAGAGGQGAHVLPSTGGTETGGAFTGGAETGGVSTGGDRFALQNKVWSLVPDGFEPVGSYQESEVPMGIWVPTSFVAAPGGCYQVVAASASGSVEVGILTSGGSELVVASGSKLPECFEWTGETTGLTAIARSSSVGVVGLVPLQRSP